MSSKKICDTCEWYESFVGVCTNADSEWCGDFKDHDESCKEWENEREQDK